MEIQMADEGEPNLSAEQFAEDGMDICQAFSALSMEGTEQQSNLAEGAVPVMASDLCIQPAEQNDDQQWNESCFPHSFLGGGLLPIVFVPDSWQDQVGQEIPLVQVDDGVCFDPVHKTLSRCAGFAVAPDSEQGSFKAQVQGASQVGLPSLSGDIGVTATYDSMGLPSDQTHAFGTQGVDAWGGDLPLDAVCRIESQSGVNSVGNNGYVLGDGGLPLGADLASVLLEAHSAEVNNYHESGAGDSLPPFTNAQIARAIRKVKLKEMRERQGKKKPKKSRSRKRAHVLKPGVLTMIPYGMDEQTIWSHRICLFTARMRAVLGDRRMSVPWGGSILDSVAGVFLTQNVSDTSSSKAFMNIAARFPSRNLPRFGTAWNRRDILQDDPVDFNPEIEPLALWNARDCSDMVDWMAVHNTDESVLAECIRCRGMHLRLAARIKTFLSRIGKENLEEWWKEKKRKEEEQKKQAEQGIAHRHMHFSSPFSSIKRQPRTSFSFHAFPSIVFLFERELLCELARERSERKRNERLNGPNSLPGVIARLEQVIGDLDVCPPSISNDEESIIVVNASEVPVISVESPRGVDATTLKESEANDGASIRGGVDCMVTPQEDVDIVPSSDDEGVADWLGYLKTLGTGNAGNQNLDIDEGLEGEEVVCDVNEVPIVLDEHCGEEELVADVQREEFDGAIKAQFGSPHDTGEVETIGNLGSSDVPSGENVEGPRDAQGCVMEGKGGMGGASQEGEKGDGEVDLGIPVPEFEKRIVVPDGMLTGEKGAKKGTDARGLPFDKLSMDWLHSLPDEEVVEYLTSSVEGLGRKSASCVMLLCMGRKDFPVDVNVARICARLGWIPLETVGNIEELDEYAPEEEVHKYLHKRIMHFDFATLYELHYQMITLGKVFCTKRAPRCGVCPLRDACEYSRNGGQRFDPSTMKPPKRKRKAFEKKAPPNKSPASPQKTDTSPPQTEGYATPRRSARTETQHAKHTEALGIFSAGSGVGPGYLTPDRAANMGAREDETPHRVEASLPDVEDLAGPMSPPPPPAKRNHGSNSLEVPMSRDSGEALRSPQEVRESVGSNRRDSPGKVRSGVCDSTPISNRVEKRSCVGGEEFPTAPLCQETPCKSNLGSNITPDPHHHHKDSIPDSGREEPAAEHSVEVPVSAGEEAMKTPGDVEVERIMELVENMSECPSSLLSGADMPLADVMDLCRSELILGLEEGQRGDNRAVKKRYHKLSMLIHPDKCSNAAAGTAFAALSEALKVATGDIDSPDDLFADLGMDDYGDDVRQAAEDCNKDNELIIHPGPPTQSRTRRVYFAIMGVGKLLNPIIQLGFPRRIEEDPNPYFLLPDPRVFPVDARADGEDLMTAARWDILPYLKEGRRDIPFLILTPSRTAMKGKFPLNGTFFQVNELFLSDIPAIYIPVANLIDSKPKWRPIYFGSSISHMSMGMQTREVAQMFHFGFVCVRGIDNECGYPTPLPKFLMP